MTTSHDDAAVLESDLVAFFERFLASDDGTAAAAAAASLDAPAVLELRTVEPDVVLHVDVGARTVAAGPAEAPGAIAEIPARDLDDLLLERLGPVEISRLLEEGRARLAGPPPALAALLVLAGRLQPHYPATLRERGRDDVLAVAGPETGVIWESDGPPPPMVGRRRPWQRERPARAAT
jgi:hypothetical protein